MSRNISNSDNVIDSRDVVERIEELREQKEPWIAGYNMAGYMPDSEPVSFADFDDAKESILSTIEGYIEDALPTDNIRPFEELKEWVEQQSGKFSQTVRGIAFWVSFDANNGLNDEEREELQALETLQSEGEASPDWQYGETFIRESYFTAYIKELIGECYPMPEGFDSSAWPFRHMTFDYEAAADEAKADYIECDFDGVTYLIRA